MKLKRNFSTVQIFALGLVVLILCAGVAQAAPAYRGKFTLPYAARWGNVVIPAGEYRLGFRDVANRTFVTIEEAKNGKFLGMVTAISVGDARSENALLIVDEGDQWVVKSLTLGELGMQFTYEPSRMHRRKEIEEAHATQVLALAVATESLR